MDFLEVRDRVSRNGTIEIYPNFRVRKCRDLMFRGNGFYAVWDQESGMWSTDEYDVQLLVDQEIMNHKKNFPANTPMSVRTLGDFSSDMWTEFKSYTKNQPESYHLLDEKLTFLNSKIKKEDYISKKLPYNLEEGSIDAYDELMSTLYSPEERAKLEWAIGSIMAGEGKNIQKFIVLYGEAGAGKSTVLNIMQDLFEGYYTTFEAKALTSNNNSFATEVFKNNPLVAIQHDGDLSKIEDNTKLNSIVSHEYMTMNEKYKASYTARVNSFLFMATNKPVKITDAKSGVIRRLIDVHPSGNTVPTKRYHKLIKQISFEMGAIAYHCLKEFESMGKNYYASYKPLGMIFQTDVFFNFVEESYNVFNRDDCTTLKASYSMYKEYCDDSLITFKLPRHKFREELKNYFYEFYDTKRVDGVQMRSYYERFNREKFADAILTNSKDDQTTKGSIALDCIDSIFDDECADCTAQYASSNETPLSKWDEVKTTLSDLDTSKIHYVMLPENHIVIDFDIKDDTGQKSYSKNIEAASLWPKTYTELSKSGKGVHLHYIYDGDATKLSRVYDDSIEVKVFVGNSSLRRKLTKCNDIPIAHISSGLPLKGDKVINFGSVQSEKGLRALILKNLRKEIHPGTKSSMDFIKKILDDAYETDVKYDVTDLRPRILAFANNSTHQAPYCVKLASSLKYKSEEASEGTFADIQDELVFYDVEVFPNLFIVVWKIIGKPINIMINPTASDMADLCKFNLIGFNNRRYDNHILYARLIGYSLIELYELSQRIVNNSKNSTFAEAYGLSYADVYDFTSKKQSLKKYEIDLGLHHNELGLPWDEPVPENLWMKVAEYCGDDVIATEAVFLSRKEDFAARQLLAEIAGLPVNSTTQKITAKILFGNEKNPQSKFEYTDLSEMFPGYRFENGHSYYRGEDPGEGGYVYSEPGTYGNVALLDIASMHPTSAILLNLFGPYTKNFKEIKDARLAVKHKDFDTAKSILNGALAKYLDDKNLSSLSYALKLAINSVYGYTSAKFENKFKDPRNIDNIVAKRGSLFMINLKHEVQNLGYTVAHIKTDSIKIPDADDFIINFVMEYGKKYGYDFEHEATYEKMCLINNAVYIAKYDDGKWTATGAQFQHPFVFKSLFSKEPIENKDISETKTVSTAIFLDFNEEDEDDHNYHFIGKAGNFVPILPGRGGGVLLRQKEEKYYAASGSKGYRWKETENVEALNNWDDIDKSYGRALVDAAVSEIGKWCDPEWFVSDDKYEPGDTNIFKKDNT